jgi:hypothetical protein
MPLRLGLLTLLVGVLLAGCPEPVVPPPTPQYAVGGSVVGLLGTLVLQNNARDDLSLTADGLFVFPRNYDQGSPYRVTVKAAPGAQQCTVDKGTGTLNTNVTTVAVTCVPKPHVVNVFVTGLKGTVVLQDNNKDDLTVTADGGYPFAATLVDGARYAVKVKTQPTNQLCDVTNGTGTVNGTDVDVTVTCHSSTLTIGGTVTGLSGTLVLQNNQGDDLTVTASGPFTFATGLVAGSAYAVTVKRSPTTQACSVSSGSGTLTANVTNVSVVCVTAAYTLSALVQGLSGTLVLQNNAGDDLVVTGNGVVTFAAPLADQMRYLVTVKTPPAAQACTVIGGSGVVAGASVSNVSVNCRNAYTLGGTVTGLSGTVVLANNGVDDLSLSANGGFAFATRAFVGEPYAVTVKTQPTGQVCRVTGGAGIVNLSNITTIAVNCLPLVTISGTVTGLTGTVVLANNLGDDLSVTADGAFTFATGIPSGSTYSVTVKTQPMGQVCAVSSGTGTASGNITGVAVVCSARTYSVSVTVTGLLGNLVLQNNLADNLSISTNGVATFSTVLPDGAPYAVTVLSTPAAQACAVAGGLGNINGANVTAITVACRTGYSIGGTVSGLLAPGSLVLQDNLADDLTLTTSGPFSFNAKLAAGGAYSVTVKTQPVNQRCVVTLGAGTVAANVTTVLVACTTTTKLLITEVGANYFSTALPRLVGSAWVEVRNISSTTVDLATYQLRAPSISSSLPSAPTSAGTFSIPSLQVPPGGYAVVRANTDSDLVNGPRVVHVGGGSVPGWMSDGFVELVNAGGTTEDFVRFGASTETPTTVDGWVGPSTFALPFTLADLGASLARNLASTDTNGADDWTPRAFGTYAGPNDVTCDTDADGDGIPDCSEVGGATFAGLPLATWGASPGRTDVFIEVDWVNPNGKGTVDPGMQPRKEALDKVAAIFATQGYTLHFDTGALFDAAAGINPTNWDLGGGDQVPYSAASCTFTMPYRTSAGSSVTSIYGVKAAHHDPARRPIFYYVLFGNVQPSAANCNAQGSSGLSEMPGNDVLITLGGWGLNTATTASTNELINKQAATLMHELGHNLGLRHGGFEERNFKPNYLSVMNYAYQLYGLPTIGHPSEGDRYYLRQAPACGTFNGIALESDLYRGPQATPADFQLDYSHGGSADMTENAITEDHGLGRPGSVPIDLDESGIYNYSTSAQVTLQAVAGGTCGPRTPAVLPLLTHQDFNDWSIIDLFNRRNVEGDRNGDGPSLYTPDPSVAWSRLNDQAPNVLVEDTPPASYFEWVRAGRR